MNLQTIYKLYNNNNVKPLFDIDFSIIQGLQKQTFYNSDGERIKKDYTFNSKIIVRVEYQNIVENGVLKGFQKVIKYFNKEQLFQEKKMSPKLYEMETIAGVLTSIEGILYKQKCEQIKNLKT